MRLWVCVLLSASLAAAQTQSAPVSSTAAAQPSAVQVGSSSNSAPGQGKKQPSTSERRRAAKLYLEAAKLYANQQFEPAMRADDEAAKLDPTNPDYEMAAQVARSHAITALVQEAAQDRIRGDQAAARAAIEHASSLDPQDPVVMEHLREMADEQSARSQEGPLQPPPNLGGPEELAPTAGKHSFHLRSSQRQVIQQVLKAYGIDATIDESVRGATVRLDLDDADFAEAMHVVSMLTGTFYTAIDPHRALVARDNREMRQQYAHSLVETVPLSGLSQTEMTDMANMAKNIFEVQNVAVDQSAGKLTVRAPEQTLNAFNSTYRDLTESRSEVMIDVRLVQLSHINSHNTGIQPPQTITAFNVYAEEQAILNANQSLVQQIISSGLAAPGDTLAILGILIASGQVTNSIFNNGLVLFGGGLTLSGLSPGGTTVQLSLSSSDSRELDDYQLRLEDGEEGTLKSGTKYPIQTASFSSLGTNSLNIPGLTGAGTSSSLSSLLASTTGATENVPQIQYQDIGLVLKATPRVLRSGDVALNVDMKISALAGQSLNGVPVLANRSYGGVITVPRNAAVVLASEMDSQEMHAISGYPGLSEVPGLNNITDKNVSKNTSTLLVILTPRVVRMPHGEGHSPIMAVEKGSTLQ